jgi:anti-sigma factor RsiW
MRRQADCSRIEEVLEAYLDGDLSAVHRDRVTAHFETCRACSAELEEARALRAALRALPQMDAPPRVLRAVAEATTTRQSAWWPHLPLHAVVTPGWRAVMAATAAALIAIVLVPCTVHRESQPPPSPDVTRAVVEARYALGIVGRLGRRASTTVREEVLTRGPVAPAIHQVLGPLHRNLLTERVSPPDRGRNTGLKGSLT